MKIEWASSFNPDGSRRKPDPSFMHGFYAKWRGTFSGNEDLRNKGMQEMRDATKFKRDQARRKREARKAEGRSIFSFFFNRKKSPKYSSRSAGHRSRSSNVLARSSAPRQATGNSRGARPAVVPRTSHASRTRPRHSKSSQSRSHHASRSGQPREHRSRRSSRRQR
ncbi:hypothetical protein E4T56_gene18748 [Termitomyces sp. T112]|nr:hypothetical protein E4T56_gene18748 [Termitomyces sp. T112]